MKPSKETASWRQQQHNDYNKVIDKLDMNSMNTSRSCFYQDQLQNAVTNADKVAHLIPLTRCISLTAVKSFVRSEIDKLDISRSRTAYYESVSINAVFPDDLIKYILQFAGLYNVKAVSKSWKQFSDQNEHKYMKELYAPYNGNSNNNTEHEIKYDSQYNKTWIIHPYRNKLNRTELEYGYKGPMKTVFNALLSCKDGDRLFFHSGTYIDYNTLPTINKNIQIIGLENDVIFENNITSSDGINNTSSYLIIGNNVYFENVHIKYKATIDGTEGAIQIEPNHKLWLNHVTVSFAQTGVTVRNKANLYTNNCVFNGGAVGIEISPIAANVDINNCLFINCGQSTGAEESDFVPSEEYGAIQVFDNYGDIFLVFDENNDQLLQLKCIANIFEDNYCYPVVERSDNTDGQYFLYNSDRFILKDNKFKGFNGTQTKQKGDINDPNELYHSPF